MRNIDTSKNPLEAKKHLAFVSENVMLYSNFSAVQNLEYFARLGGHDNYKRDDYHAVLTRVGLAERFHDIDDDSGLLHEAHLAWNALARLEFKLRGDADEQEPPEEYVNSCWNCAHTDNIARCGTCDYGKTQFTKYHRVSNWELKQ